MSKIIAISNQKGGVGKTTTSVNLSSSLAALEKKVLLIDFDPQANSTSSIGIEINIGSKTIYDLLENECSSDDCINKTNLEFLDVIPAHIDLVGIEIESIDMIEREYLLRNTIFGFKADYDFIIIDCPPSLGLLTINALTAADSVLIPIQCEYLALEGLGKLLNTIKSIQKLHNKELSIEQLQEQMFVIDTQGNARGGATAVRYLSRKLRLLWPLALLLHIPGSLPIWNWLYAYVAKRRLWIAGRCDATSCQIHQK